MSEPNYKDEIEICIREIMNCVPQPQQRLVRVTLDLILVYQRAICANETLQRIERAIK